jgi:hypothetical protein
MPNCVFAPFSRPCYLQYSGSANLKPYVALELHPGILHTSIL